MASSSNIDASNSSDDEAWEQSVAEHNRQLDRIIEDVVIHAASLSVQPTNHAVRGRRRYIERRREIGHEGVFEQYFSEDPIYPPEYFRTRFRMRKPLFERIMNKLVATDRFFQQHPDAAGRLGMSPIQKCTAAMRVLAYGTSADLHDEYLRMSAQVIRKSVIKFVEGVISNFGAEYLRKPTEEDMAALLHIGERRGFPGMMGSIDCLRNDINVLDQSPVFDDILEGRAPKVNYIVNGHERNMGYYLTDGIYPQWAAFIKSIPAPQLRKHQLFSQHQEAARKDVERAFGVLQARFAFIKRPCLIWDRDIMGKIMIACIIMHNMIVEDERSTYLNYHDPTEFIEDRLRQNTRQSEDGEGTNDFVYSTNKIASLASYMRTRSQLRNREDHSSLLHDLIEHIWQKFGDDN
ncbi:uncharacterized protein LOC130998658 [Salvia miltiorrhiza]|uniref:uncharacterized protein LOC130998658 n=1 Tax=Salvia miltiorrhiza TaxID=226208 RepID=UPI0025ABCE5F|nr:uncharacterized protein LOC130998658 [Salvia miltiorrhiza]